MKRILLGKILSAALLIGGLIAVASAPAQSLGYGPGDGMGSGGMMGDHGTGWMGGGYGGIWLLVLIVAFIAGVVAWVVAQKRK